MRRIYNYIVAGLLVLECLHLGATDKKKLKPKEGAVLLLNNGDSHIWIDSIDDAHTGVKPHGLYELTPGVHTVRAHLYYIKNQAEWSSHTYVDYPFEAKAGMVLNVVCDETIESYGGQGKGTWRLWVEEVASGKDIHEIMQATVLAAQEQEHEQQLARNFGETKVKAEQGDLESQYELGLLYQRGEGVAVNPGEGLAWFRKAALRGHATAQYLLGLAFDGGDGVGQDRTEAYVWMSLANIFGNTMAPYFLDETEKLLTPDQLRLAKEKAQKLEKDIRAALPQ